MYKVNDIHPTIPMAKEAAQTDANFLPEATDEIITEYRNKFRVMTNAVAQGCLAHPRGNYANGDEYFLLSRSQATQVTNMIRLLLKRVDSDKEVVGNLTTLKALHENEIRDLTNLVRLMEKRYDDQSQEQSNTSMQPNVEDLEIKLREAKERNLILHQKIQKMAAIQAELSNRVDEYQYEALQRENQKLFDDNQALEKKLREREADCSKCSGRQRVIEELKQKMASVNLDMQKLQRQIDNPEECKNCKLLYVRHQEIKMQARELQDQTERYRLEIDRMRKAEKELCEKCGELRAEIANCDAANVKLIEQKMDLIKQSDHLKFFIQVILRIYPDVDPYYVRNIIKELIVTD